MLNQSNECHLARKSVLRVVTPRSEWRTSMTSMPSNGVFGIGRLAYVKFTFDRTGDMKRVMIEYILAGNQYFSYFIE